MRYARDGYHNLERTEGTRGRADVSGRQHDRGGSHTSPIKTARRGIHLECLCTSQCSMRNKQKDNLCTAAKLGHH